MIWISKISKIIVKVKYKGECIKMQTNELWISTRWLITCIFCLSPRLEVVSHNKLAPEYSTQKGKAIHAGRSETKKEEKDRTLGNLRPRERNYESQQKPSSETSYVPFHSWKKHYKN